MSGPHAGGAGAPGLVLTTDGLARESFGDPARGDASWFTLFSADRTPTERMSAGVMELPPGGAGLRLHRHAEPEIYCVVAGSGALRIGGVETPVAAGSVAFIPGDAVHTVRNTGADVLRVFYVFPTDRFSDVAYRFSEPADPARDDPFPPPSPSAAP